MNHTEQRSKKAKGFNIQERQEDRAVIEETDERRERCQVTSESPGQPKKINKTKNRISKIQRESSEER